MNQGWITEFMISIKLKCTPLDKDRKINKIGAQQSSGTNSLLILDLKKAK